ncbi:glycoside hydrolase domain-containing protein [Aeromicrobium sp.]|uniref:glycoside hydrolase domain-containing protein n=1 Tax=Aeromicrobium sp. TaxID=1871063 RepID=UPI0019BC0407|nr:glycoside hydrolase domain-containing protein [Aeromicrobium sp.]MBC7633066.1 DUF1906 domain-containing protein [Aeromicrobium sp.]
MSSPASRLRIAGLITGFAATLLLSSTALTSPAGAATPASPGSFTGFGFDACVAPSQKVMDAWNLRSPYAAIGIYVSGSSRYCGDKYQPNLSKAWVATNASHGWRFLPIHVGRQSPCYRNDPDSRAQRSRMSTSPTKARAQGKVDAAETIGALQKYGLPKKTASYLDLEWYARSRTCDNAVLEFVDGWTDYLHAKGYTSGVYSSGSSAIAVIDEAREARRKHFTLPDHLWVAWTNKKADTKGGPYLSDAGWKNHQRIHQYHNGVNQTFGGHQLNIDKDYLDVGKGSVASSESLPCNVRMSFSRYPRLEVGDKGPAVATLQCLLHRQGLKKSVTESFGTGTSKAIEAYRNRLGWKPLGRTTRATWTALFSSGTRPRVLKQGSVGQSVWRLQHSLSAAGLSLSPTGVYDPRTVAAVRAFRKARGLSAYDTTDTAIWSLLQHGKTA